MIWYSMHLGKIALGLSPYGQGIPSGSRKNTTVRPFLSNHPVPFLPLDPATGHHAHAPPSFLTDRKVQTIKDLEKPWAFLESQSPPSPTSPVPPPERESKLPPAP